METFHRLIEQELFVVEPFFNRSDFLDKVCTYQLFFNYARSNSYKNNQTPISIIRQRDPSINPVVGMLQPVFLESLLPKPLVPTLSSSPQGVTMYHPWSYNFFWLIAMRDGSATDSQGISCCASFDWPQPGTSKLFF